MPKIALEENSVDFEKLTEILLAHLEKESSDRPFLIVDDVKVIL